MLENDVDFLHRSRILYGSEAMEKLRAKGINVEYMYAYVGNTIDSATFVFKTDSHNLTMKVKVANISDRKRFSFDVFVNGAVIG